MPRLAVFDASLIQKLGILTEGTDANDILYGNNQIDYIYGYGGHDTLFGGAHNDFLYGGDGSDTLLGESGNDALEGESGHDTLIGGAGADILNGGTGRDTASYATAAKGVFVDLTTGAGTNDAAGDTFISIENLTGSSFDDVLNGNSAANVIHGGSGYDYILGQGGNDRLFGDNGNDILNGGNGFDYLIGGTGSDELTGGAGSDVFVLAPVSGTGFGVDNLVDFQRGEDLIDVRAFGPNPFGSDGILARAHALVDMPGIWATNYLSLEDRLAIDTDDNTLYQITVTQDENGYFHVASFIPIAHVPDARDVYASSFTVGTPHDLLSAQAFRLYQAAFDRTPDEDGLAYWINQMERGMSLSQVATNFVQSSEFQATYGNVATMSNEAIVSIMYQNVLDRAPDQAGLSYWMNDLANGLSRSSLLVQFSESAENQGHVAPAIQNVGILDYGAT